MAGERQHHLPQFLQRGFASKQVDDATFTWVYRKEKAPFESNTRNVGLERKFYNQGHDSSVDIAISEAEAHEFSVVIKSARSALPGSISLASFPRLFAHLEVRSRQIREVLGTASAVLIQKTFDTALESLPALIEKRLGDAPKELRDLLLSRLQPRLAAVIQEEKARLAESNAESVKSAHLQALRKGISPEARVNQYKHLDFSVVDVAINDLILGDGAVLFHIQGEKQFKSMFDKGDVIIAALLPLSPNRILVGSAQEYSIDSLVLRRAVAQCSHEFFISNERSDINEQLAAEIGSDSAVISESELDEIIRDAVAESI